MKKYILTTVIIILLIFISGCGKDSNAGAEKLTPAADLSAEQKLKISATETDKSGTLIPSEELGKNDNLTIAYSGLAEVKVNLDGVEVPLEEAIRDEKLTLPEILAFARKDAQNGICKEEYTSEHGVTHFVYTYPECELHLTYDVYETPDGKQTLIEELYVYNITDNQRSISHFYVDEESEWGYFLDRENWGLSFEVIDASPTQITLDCTQNGGQQIGDLVIESYFLYASKSDEAADGAPKYIGWAKPSAEGLPISIPMDASGQITLDWTDIAGTLAPGSYYICLSIFDVYEESQVHPLMENYYDRQSYYIPFSVE